MYVNEIVSAELASQSAHIEKPRSLGAAVLVQMGRMRFQVLGGLLTAVILPAAIVQVASRFLAEENSYRDTLVGTTIAFLLGYLIFRKVTGFPGVRATAYLLPAFLASYAIVVVGFFMLRLDYNRLQFAASFALTTAFFYALFFIVRRARPLELALAAVGDVGKLRKLTFVRWRQFASPDQAPPACPIVIDLQTRLTPEWERFIADSALAGRPIYNAKQVFESLSGRVQVQHLSENTFGALGPNTIYAAAKHQLDFVLALLALVLLGPLLLLLSIAIRLDSKGPALFRQERMGRGGKPFTVYKFRTMHVQEADGQGRQEQMTLADDKRITRLGRVLRRTRLDELPQILNILRGEMSWIGPRPEALKLSEWYDSQIPFYCYRHLVRPGITGWAQVSQGHVTSVEDADLKLQFDFFYVKHFSLWLDLLVVLRTIRVVATGAGAR